MGEPIERITRAELTRYANIYKNVYWGWCSLKGDEILQDSVFYSKPKLIENRNRFIEEHRIKRVFKLPSRRPNYKYLWHIFSSCNQDRVFDHRECYLTRQNTIIILVSPYLVSPYGDSTRDKILSYGFKETYEMYGTGTISYYLEIPNKLNSNYLKTVELEKYWGKPISELISAKKGFLYWMRVMRYEQKFIIIQSRDSTIDESFVLERDHSLILDFMNNYSHLSSDVNSNLYEYHKFINQINRNCWESAILDR